MNTWLKKIGLFAITGMFSSSLFAGFTVLAGEFEAEGPRLPNLWTGYWGTPTRATQQFNFTVSVTGNYRIEDVYSHWYSGLATKPGAGTYMGLYRGEFNPLKPEQNRLNNEPYFISARNLQAGVEYTLVIQNVTNHSLGVWTIVANGPGEVISPARAELPNLGSGKFTGSEAKIKNACSDAGALYRIEGPFRVAREGLHYITNMSHLNTQSTNYGDSRFCFTVYTAQPDVTQPDLNQVSWTTQTQGVVDLDTDTDYYLLVQSNTNEALEYFYLVAPPVPFEITEEMSGLWADLETDGQGLMLNVYPSINSLHLAWFTYDLEQPSVQATAQMGDAGHRWLTAFGELDGAESDMVITRTHGGIFDATQPVPAQIQDGSVQLRFDSCTSGTLTYNLGSVNAAGQLNLKRPFEDPADLRRCMLANMGPGIPGPL